MARACFHEQVDRINGIYFFDRRDNEFYSVFITDYFLADPDATNDFPDSPYTIASTFAGKKWM